MTDNQLQRVRDIADVDDLDEKGQAAFRLHGAGARAVQGVLDELERLRRRVNCLSILRT